MDFSGGDVVREQNLDKNWPYVPKRPVARWRTVTANWLSLIALAHLLAGALAMAYLYWYAVQKGLPISRASGSSAGPWARHDELGEGIKILLEMQLRSFCISAISFFFNLSIRAVIVLVLSLLFGFFAFSMIGLVED